MYAKSRQNINVLANGKEQQEIQTFFILLYWYRCRTALLIVREIRRPIEGDSEGLDQHIVALCNK